MIGPVGRPLPETGPPEKIRRKVGVILDAETDDAFRAYCLKRNTTRSAVLRKAIARYVREDERSKAS